MRNGTTLLLLVWVLVVVLVGSQSLVVGAVVGVIGLALLTKWSNS